MKVFIENEAGLDQKNIYNEKTLEYKKTYTVSRPYPYPYGFILETTSGDGDNLDCFVITHQKLKQGQVVECEIVGMMEQKEDGQEDHNVLARLPSEEVILDTVIQERLTDFVSHVFDHLPGKNVKVGDFLGKGEAEKYINQCLDGKYKGRKYKVLDYSKDWQASFLVEADILKSILKDDALAIEHIGSTAVEGLAGKPTIDVLVVVENIAIVDKHAPEMIAAGYRDLGEYVLPETRLFVREEDNTRLVNVHFFLQGHPHTEEMILVRNYLRSHPEEVKEYSELKRRLYQEHPDDYGAYRKPKDEYMEELLKRAKSTKL